MISFMKIAFCCPMYEGYGQTEACSAATITNEMDGESGHVGGVITNTEMKLVSVPELDYLVTDTDEEGDLAPRGEVCF